MYIMYITYYILYIDIYVVYIYIYIYIVCPARVAPGDGMDVRRGTAGVRRDCDGAPEGYSKDSDTPNPAVHRRLLLLSRLRQIWLQFRPHQ